MLRPFIHIALTVIFTERFLRDTQLSQDLATLFRNITCYTFQVGDGPLKRTLLLDQGIACPEPVPPCLLIDKGSHGHLFERAAELCIGQFKRPANFDLFTGTEAAAAKCWGYP